VFFLDNADQRDEEVQQQAFLNAQELAEHWPALVFVTLRPETFHVSRRFGSLSGYHAKAFTISPPRVDRVIRKRLEFAVRITSGELPIQQVANLGLRLDTLDGLMRVFLHSLDANADLATCLVNISGGNVRLALDLVRQFFGSGHINTEKIYAIYRDQGSYTIPLHEFLRAVIYGDTRYYDSDRSPLTQTPKTATAER
jgi:hypothetical protein